MFPCYCQVIKRSQGLDEVLSRLDPQAAEQHFAAIQRWKEKREMMVPRKGRSKNRQCFISEWFYTTFESLFNFSVKTVNTLDGQLKPDRFSLCRKCPFLQSFLSSCCIFWCYTKQQVDKEFKRGEHRCELLCSTWCCVFTWMGSLIWLGESRN